MTLGGRPRLRATVAVAATALLTLGPVGLGAAPDRTPHLVILRADGSELAVLPLPGDAVWHLAWRHSVTGILVRDYYAYRDGAMLLTHSHAPSFDAGLGHLPGRGRVVSDDEHGYWILDLNEPVPSAGYRLRVGSPEVAHTLHVGEPPHLSLNLSERAAHEAVTIRVEQR